MSRIGNRVLSIPDNVEVTLSDNHVNVKGPKGELTHLVPRDITVSVEEKQVKVKRANDIKTTKQVHGTTNAIIKNMIEGVSDGFSKGLEIVGVGYRFQVSGKNLVINACYSHQVTL